MKSVFVAISILLFFSCGTQAKDIEEILEDAIGQIFRQTRYGFELSLEPYLSMELDERGEISAEYSLIGESPANTFKRTWGSDSNGVYTATTTDVGTLRNAGFLADMWSYHFRRSNNYNYRQVETLDPNAMSYNWDLSIDVDGQVTTSVGELSVSNLDIVGNSASIKYVEKVDMKQNSPYCDLASVMGFRCPFQMDADFTITAEAAQCASPQNSCAASLSLVGTSNNEAISVVLGYTARVQRGTQINQIGATLNDNNLFQLTLRTPAGSDVTNVFGKCGDDLPEHIITLPNPRRFGRIAGAAEQYFGGIANSVGFILEQAPESLIWFDAVIATATDEFDCTGLVQASAIRIPVLNRDFTRGFYGPAGNKISGANFQEFGQSFCFNFNRLVIQGLTEAGNQIAEGRRYVNQITSPAHGARFAANL